MGRDSCETEVEHFLCVEAEEEEDEEKEKEEEEFRVHRVYGCNALVVFTPINTYFEVHAHAHAHRCCFRQS